jgi:hypothetical protein
MQIVKPTQARVRDAWPREDRDFTPWLAENLDVLDELGLGFSELECVGKEVPVPGTARKLDLLATTPAGLRVAIENQYRSVDHDHLTRGLAYAVGTNAHALVIIAEDHQDEFVAVADYLNQAAESMGEDGIGIFLLTLSVEAVEDYLVPRFQVRSRPNAWRSEVWASNTAAAVGEAQREREESQHQFWSRVVELARERQSHPWAGIRPARRHYIDSRLVAGLNITLGLVGLRNRSYVHLYIDAGDPSANVEILRRLESEIDREKMPFDLEWDPKEGSKSCSVRTEPIPDFGPTMNSADSDLMEKLLDQAAAFQAAIEDPLLAIIAELDI